MKRAKDAAPRIIFIDRDGVINKDPGGWTKHSYVTSWREFHFLPGVKEAIKKLTENGYDIVMISNQAGVSKGYYTERRLVAINTRMLKAIEASGGKIRKTYYCIHQDSDECDCRKPKTGLLKAAERHLGIKAGGRTYFIGDGRVDIEAGRRAGLKTILVLSGKTSLDDVRQWRITPDLIVKDLKEAVNFVLEKKRTR